MHIRTERGVVRVCLCVASLQMQHTCAVESGICVSSHSSICRGLCRIAVWDGGTASSRHGVHCLLQLHIGGELYQSCMSESGRMDKAGINWIANI